MHLKCPKCGGTQNVKNGKVFGWQRHKCKQCGYQFTKISPKGKPLSIKLLSHQLYISGLSMREISKILGITAQTVSRWIKKWHPAYMSDIGSREVLYHAVKENLFDYLSLKPGQKLIVSSEDLPSGAKVNIIICLPEQEQCEPLNH